MGRYLIAALLGAAAYGAGLPGFTLADTAGASHTQAEWHSAKAVVLYFITTDCPISNGYVPEMNRIAQDYAARGVRFYGVIADTMTPVADVRKHVQEFGYTFPVLLDPKQTLVQFTNADTTPEAAVVAPGGALKYLGRIDNRVEGFGKQRPQATERDLRDGLEAVLAGKAVARASVPAVGCSIVRVP